MCGHERFEVDGTIHEKGKFGNVVTVRSYRCLDCGAVWQDRTNPSAKPTAPVKPGKKEEKQMTKETEKTEKNEKSKRLTNALEDGRWEVGSKYERVVTCRKGKGKGKKVVCTMKVGKDGFIDQDGKTWDTPTALTTNFVIKHCGASEGTRRPASTFFKVAIPKSKKVQTRPPAKPKAPKAAKAAKPKAAKRGRPPKADKVEKPTEKAEPEKTEKAEKAEKSAPPKLDI